MFRYRKGIIDLDAKVPDRAFDFGVAEQELNRPQVARALIDQGRLGSPERMGPEEVPVQPDASDPLGDEPRVLPGRHARSRTPTGEQKIHPAFCAQLSNSRRPPDESVPSIRT